MTRPIPALAALAAFGLALPSHAQTRPGWEIGAQVFDYGYEETFENPLDPALEDGRVNDDGTFIGLEAAYTWVRGPWNFKIKLETSASEVDYGATVPGLGVDALENVRQSIGQLHFLVGRDFPLANGSTLTPFAGFGARVLIDDSGGLVSDQGLEGYDREINYFYMPIGLRWTSATRNGASVTLAGQYNWLTDGESRALTSGLAPSATDSVFQFQDGHGLEASAMLNLHRGRRMISVGPYVRYWSMDRTESNFVTVGPDLFEEYEPDNTTTEIGLRASFAF